MLSAINFLCNSVRGLPLLNQTKQPKLNIENNASDM